MMDPTIDILAASYEIDGLSVIEARQRALLDVLATPQKEKED
jgi:hypothetical protein